METVPATVTPKMQKGTFDIVVNVPKHSSSMAGLFSRDETANRADCLLLCCYKPGVLWHGLYPMLFESDNKRISKRLLKLLFAQSWRNNATIFRDLLKRLMVEPQQQQLQTENDDGNAPFHRRAVSIQLPILSKNQQQQQPIHLFILPPFRETFLDRTFTAVVLEHERTLLKKQTMTAWMATLGGGYFFIKQLSKSLQLARQQRYLALQIGNESMARTCLLNEAYNLIYAGHFPQAKQVLTTLETQVKTANSKSSIPVLEEDEIERTLRQCHAARILLRRLKKLKHRLKGYQSMETHTVDDFQRVRIVEKV